MNIALFFSILLAILGGALEGLFSLPVTRTPRWRWENIWGAGLLIALVAVPWPLAFLTVPHLLDVFRQVKPTVLLTTVLFGVGWGIGNLFWGKAIAAVGVALGVSLMMGLINVFGSPMLLAITNPRKLAEPGGMALLAAVAVTILGVILCAMAGHFKDREMAMQSNDTSGKRPSFLLGLLYCVISGIFSASVNFGLVFGEPIAVAAQAAGASDAVKNNAIWAMVFTGNFSIAAIYCFFLMVKNRTLSLLVSQGSLSYWLGALFLGLALPLGIVLYGIGASRMGEFGPYVAFPMMLVSSILFGNLAGAMTGEWRGASRKTKMTMLAGVTILVAAFVMFGAANRLLQG
jgi:L-rhamnose-H+ transport protein